jgi:hypothetical protein
MGGQRKVDIVKEIPINTPIARGRTADVRDWGDAAVNDQSRPASPQVFRPIAAPMKRLRRVCLYFFSIELRFIQLTV